MPNDRRREPLQVEVWRWSDTTSPNRRYKGGPPADVAQALLRQRPTLGTEKAPERDTGDYYRFFDATPQTEFLYRCIE